MTAEFSEFTSGGFSCHNKCLRLFSLSCCMFHLDKDIEGLTCKKHVEVNLCDSMLPS